MPRWARSLAAIVRSRLPKTRLGKAALCVFLAFMLVGMGVGLWSSFPSFCASCHHVRPFYASWKVSPHGKKGVGCLKCHVEPGPVAYVKVKLNGLVEVAKYAMGAYPTKLRAEVSDSVCLRGGCHSLEKLASGPVDFDGISFPHKAHVVEEVGGMRLRCASCHAASLHSESETVSVDLCVLCHLKPRQGDSGAAGAMSTGCADCHTPPAEVKTAKGRVFDHSAYAQDGQCSKCHAEATGGDGRVAADRCHTCHNEGQRHAERMGDVGFVHLKHVTENQVACYECHSRMEHGRSQDEHSGSSECRTCHAGHGQTVARMYAGRAEGQPAMPDPMQAAGVDCSGCHSVDDHVPGPAACVECHGQGYGKMVDRWKDGFEYYISGLEGELATLQEGDLPPVALEAVKSAETRIGFVKSGRGVHNVVLAKSELLKAQTAIETARSAAGREGKSGLFPRPEEVAASCLRVCHFGAETTRFPIEDRDFPHGRHVLSDKVKCSQCHSLAEGQHGMTSAKAMDCASCHHGSDASCLDCHTTQSSAYLGRIDGAGKGMPSFMARKKVVCEACHEGVSKGHSREAVRRTCQDCHGDLFGRILDEWQETMTEALAELDVELARAESALGRGDLNGGEGAALAAAVKSARTIRVFFLADGSRGSHNPGYFSDAVDGAADALRAARRKFGE